MEEVLKVQEKYLGNGGKSTGQTVLAPLITERPSPTTNPDADLESVSNEEEAIPEQDLAVVENYELLQNYDFLKKFDFADQPGETRPRVNSN